MSYAVKTFLQAANGLADCIENEDDRVSVLSALYELVGKIESPWDTLVRLYLSQPMTSAALKLLDDLRLFERWQQNGNSPMTSAQLASLANGCDAALIHRLLRLLAANHLLEMTPDGKYKPTRFCMKLAEPDFGITAEFYRQHFIPMSTHMPEFFAKTGYQNPGRSRATIFDSTFDYGGGLFKYLEEHPDQGEIFNVVQKTSTSIQARWTSIYPSHRLLDCDPKLPLLVDVGGSAGQDIQCFYEKHPETASGLYLEDFPAVLADKASSLARGINKVPYDFFTPHHIY
ncbi:O-methyltransferase [Colletotrichum shisoi]|uniref:O-methyltransferase n=1 Tax=Colletotrichum shisoi TaxID=2078593 RepID=A0A5Q4C117_9PEZI|nr:O-methyltransferase [Colletotrichum shisoi]